jgi:hypothetical protein
MTDTGVIAYACGSAIFPPKYTFATSAGLTLEINCGAGAMDCMDNAIACAGELGWSR